MTTNDSNVDVSGIIDEELDAQKRKAGSTDEENDIVEDDIGINGEDKDESGSKKEDQKTHIPPPPPNVYPLSTMLCGFHFAALKMATKKAGSLTMEDFAYPEDLKPSLEASLQQVLPNIINNPYFIIGGILLIHTQNMMGLAKQKDDEKIKVVTPTSVTI